MIAVADKKYTLRIPEELHAKLEQQAKQERRSLHQQMLLILQNAVSSQEKPGSEEKK